MFRNTGYFNPTGFRRTISSYAPVTPQQAANRFTLKYVPSYVPPPPPPTPAPVYDNNDGGGNDSYSGSGTSYWNGQYQGQSGDHYSGGDNDFNDNMNDAGMNDFGDGDIGWSHGGTIPPMYAQTGSFVDGVKQTDLDLGTALALAKDKAGSVLGTITGQEKESFLAGKTASELGFTRQILDAMQKPESIFGAILGLAPGTTTLAKEVGVPAYDAYIDFVNEYSDQGIANAALEANIAKALSPPVGIAEQTAFEEKNVGDYSIDDSITIELPSLYDKYSIAAQQELDTAIPSQPPGIGPGPATPSGIPDMGITPATSSSELSEVHGVSSDIDAAINDIANEIDTPTTSSPPSTISDHANVHGPDPLPATPDMGTDFGDGYNSADAPSVGSGLDSMDSYSGGHPGMGGGSNSMGGGDMGVGNMGEGFGYDGGFDLAKGGHIYASQGGYVNSTGGK